MMGGGACAVLLPCIDSVSPRNCPTMIRSCPPRVGTGAVGMMGGGACAVLAPYIDSVPPHNGAGWVGGGACAVLVPTTIRSTPCRDGGGWDARWGRLRRPGALFGSFSLGKGDTILAK